MPRPERELAGSGPIESLAAGLRELRRRAGSPGYRELAARAGVSASTLANAASGKHLPTMAATLAYVRACDGDPGCWERQWRQAAAECVGSRPSGAADDPPYQGLLSYGVEDGARFFGRDAMRAQLLKMLERQRFVAVFGASGSGKSSLLRAGLIPALADGEPVLVIDQFEELFTHCPDPARRSGFVDRIAAMVTGGATVVLGVRADFYARCAELPVLAGLLAGRTCPFRRSPRTSCATWSPNPRARSG